MPHRLTVLQVLPALDSGGVERGTLDVSRALVAAGHRSLVMSVGGRLVSRLESEGGVHLTRNIRSKSLLTLRHVLPVRRLLASGDIDVLHVRSRMPAWVVWLAWKSLPASQRPRLVTTIHGPYTPHAYSAVMVRAERVIAISENIRDYIRSNYRVPEKNIRLIYRGIDPAEFAYGHRPADDWLSKWRTEYPQLAGKKVLALPARLTRWKGQEDFIALIKRLVDVDEPVHGLIVGDTQSEKRDFAAELRAKVTATGLDAHITFTGHRGDLRDVMSVSDIVFSLAREPEAFGRVPVEALALGVPTIGYDHGGVGESLRAIYPAGLVPLGNMDALVAKTLAFLNTPPPVPPDQPFTLQRMTDATLALYQELVESPR
jgi:glycosyltransferase involved in cell wall biosynthesis